MSEVQQEREDTFSLDDMKEQEEVKRRNKFSALILLRALLAVLLIFILLFAGYSLGLSRNTSPAENSVDVGFSRDMQAHHLQAVQMSQMVLDTSTDAEVRQIALDILLTQQQQTGQMYGWLDSWGVSQRGGDVMGWMKEGEHTGHDMSQMEGMGTTPAVSNDLTRQNMPGMATTEQLQTLNSLEGSAADVMYLELMIPHHRAALGMADAAAKRGETSEVRRLAGTIMRAQSAEIMVLEQMLDKRKQS